MDKEINKAIAYHQIIELIYVASKGTITKRQVKPIKMNGDYLLAYCFLRQSTRTFKIEQILACAPVIKSERAVM